MNEEEKEKPYESIAEWIAEIRHLILPLVILLIFTFGLILVLSIVFPGL